LEEEAIRGWGYYSVFITLIGFIAMFAFIQALLTGEETVYVLGMKLPRAVLLVITPCHFITLPWTIHQIVGALRAEEWFMRVQVWLFWVTLGMSVVENYFRLPETPLVFCVCLFVFLSSLYTFLLAVYAPEVGMGRAQAVLNAVPTVMWLLYALRFGALGDLVAAFAFFIMVVLNVYLIHGMLVRGEEAFAYGLLIARLVDLSIFAWLSLTTPSPIVYLGVLLNLLGAASLLG